MFVSNKVSTQLALQDCSRTLCTVVQLNHNPAAPLCFLGRLTPSMMLATANKVEGEISSWFLLMEARRLSAVSLSPSLTSQNLSVFAVHSTITYMYNNQITNRERVFNHDINYRGKGELIIYMHTPTLVLHLQAYTTKPTV